jgi:hypothetical protein
MNVTSEQFELIVQRVLERLGTPAPSPSNAAPAVVAPPAPAIAEQVVTQALLTGAVIGSKSVRIGARAILTPSARDFVRNNGIEIIRESTAVGSTAYDRWQIIVTSATPQIEIAAAVEGLKQHGISCDLRLLGLPAEAAAQAVSAICRGEAKRVVVLTNQPELVACLANRNDRVRAAALIDAPAVERVQKDLNANVLAIDPLGMSLHELKACFSACMKS